MTNQKHVNYGTVPKNCHMWKQKEPDLKLETIKTYPEGSYPTYADGSVRSLKKCSDCGQLYFYEMAESIDWEDGNDPIYRTYIPVLSEKIADKLALLSELEIPLQTPRIQKDWTQDGARSFAWTTGEQEGGK